MSSQTLDYDEVQENCENVHNTEKVLVLRAILQTFLPDHALKRLVTKERVQQTLKNALKKDDESIKVTTDYVMKHAKKVFLTLVYVQQASLIPKFQQANFNDDKLHIDLDKLHTDLSKLGLSGWHHDMIKLQRWVFCPAVFGPGFSHKFKTELRLPFTNLHGSGEGHFGVVYKLLLHAGHLVDEKGPEKNNVRVALKMLKTSDSAADKGLDVNAFYVKELETLSIMKDIDHPHLIKAIATYDQHDQRCFMFPWADGGNLRHFWENDTPQINKELIAWTLNQMLGLSEGVELLHGCGRIAGLKGEKSTPENVRHGDLKPENILRFPESELRILTRPRGILVIADVGISKIHPNYTRDRQKLTTHKYIAVSYDPPEVSGLEDKISRKETAVTISRRYDIWGLGCIFLEFVVWMLYGVDHYKKVTGELSENVPDAWKKGTAAIPKVHPVVQGWANKMRHDLDPDSALLDLIDLIKDKLLVPLDDPTKDEGSDGTANNIRATAQVLVQELVKIRDKFQGQEWDKSKVRQLVKKRKASEKAGQDDGAKDQYVSGISVEMQARPRNRLMDCFPDFEHSNAGGCSLCRFLFHCLSGRDPKPQGSVKLVRNDASHAFRVAPDGPAVISTYADPDAKGDAPSFAKFGLPCLPEPESPQQFKLLAEWIRRCDDDHNCLAGREDSGVIASMPTRLIDVGDTASSPLCLVETDKSVKGNYVALSHRWGDLEKGEGFCTYRNNVKDLKRKIPYDLLPKSFQDAVRVTRDLGVRYLWIDSLCIIQCDKEDWKSEAGKMEDVFSNAYCTIAASSAESSLKGFLGKRTQRQSIAVQTSQRLLYLARAIDDFQTDVEKSVLGKRGWVFQERALSRRTIFFTSTQVYWECGKGIECETLAHLRNPERQFLGDSAFPKYGLQYYKDERIRLVQRLYRDYCALGLTKPTDRPEAILGLQKRLGRTFETKAHRGVIWKYFERTLLWQAKERGGLLTIDYGNVDAKPAPSWSWMARLGEIEYMDIPFRAVNWTENIPRPDKENDRLRGEASRLSLTKAELDQRATLDSSEYEFDQDSWMCIVVGESKPGAEKEDGIRYVLLVRPTSSTLPPQSYERVGVGKLTGSQIIPVTTPIDLV